MLESLKCQFSVGGPGENIAFLQKCGEGFTDNTIIPYELFVLTKDAQKYTNFLCSSRYRPSVD